MQSIAPNLWFHRYPLPMLGADIRRNVTVIRLSSGDLVIHSTAPFTAEDVAAISALGSPKWIVDAMLRHDTFAKEGRDAFPNASYLAPAGFAADEDFPIGDLMPPPPEWGAELQVMEVEGVPTFKEYVFFHAASRTLIVADLVFNFGSDESMWTEFLLKMAIGGEHHPGMSRPFRAAIEDETSFRNSMNKMFEWDFDRVIVGHGDIIETGGKEKAAAMLQAAGLRGAE
jgi:hypothetical protein